jgi:PAS domain S-box-containing protein
MTTTLRWTLGPRNTLGLAVALLLLLAVGFASAWQVRSFRHATQRVRHSLEIANAIESVTRRLVDAETGQRGFLLTNRPEYLEPLTKARTVLPGELEELDQLVANDAAEREKLARIPYLVRAKLDELARTIEVRRTQGLEASLAIVNNDEGKRLMDEIRRTLDTMTSDERTALSAAAVDARNARVVLFLAIASALAFSMVAACAIAINAQGRRRLAVQGQLMESEERLRVTLRSIGDAVIATDPDGRIVFMNPIAELLTGWTTSDASGRPLAEVFVIANEDTRTSVENPVARVIREGMTVGLANHTVLFARDGREIPIDDSAAPIRDASRTVMGVVLVFRDVAERRRLEQEAAHATRLEGERAEAERNAEALRASEERYRSLIAASTDIVWTAGADGTFDEPQPGWEAYTGQRWPQDAGQGWANAVHPDDRPTIVRLWEAAQVTRSVLEVEGRVWHALSGEYRHCRARGVPLLGPDGALRQWVGMIEDVHARRAAELANEELLRVAEHARRQAEAANQAKDEFLAVLSHELRSPLQTMLTWVGLLRESNVASPATEHAFDALEHSLGAQEQLINDLLEVSRIVSGKLTVEHTPFDLSPAATACIDRLLPEAAAKGIVVERRGLDVPRPALGDSARLAQALHNVLQNAIKFTPADGRVEVDAVAVDGRHALVVRDSGAGIAPDVLAPVFDRFWQADSAKTRRHGGLGLGLAIARHVLEAQGGTLTGTSDGLGHGATFTLTLSVAELGALAAPAVEWPRPTLDGLRVLLVEDDEAMSEALAALLEHHGAVVVPAGSVQKALGMLADAAPDVLLSDIGMPGESGYSLIREVRAREAGGARRLPALAMTGFASPEDRDEARAAGFDDHVPKPVDADTLMRKILDLTRDPTGGPA